MLYLCGAFSAERRGVRFGEGQGGPEGGVLNGKVSFLGQALFFMDMDDSAPLPPFNWAMSLYVACKSEAEFDAVFAGLSPGGTVMMGPEPVMDLRKVAWVTDKFGVTWQPVWA